MKDTAQKTETPIASPNFSVVLCFLPIDEKPDLKAGERQEVLLITKNGNHLLGFWDKFSDKAKTSMNVYSGNGAGKGAMSLTLMNLDVVGWLLLKT